MLEIRDAQMREFERAARANFHRRLTTLFRQELPEKTKDLDDATLLSRIAAADVKAQSHGIETERGIARFAGISLLAGPDFDEAPPVKEFLNYPGLKPDERIELLSEQLAEYQLPPS